MYLDVVCGKYLEVASAYEPEGTYLVLGFATYVCAYVLQHVFVGWTGRQGAVPADGRMCAYVRIWAADLGQHVSQCVLLDVDGMDAGLERDVAKYFVDLDGFMVVEKVQYMHTYKVDGVGW